MTKPFDLNELILRIRNILARATTKVLPNHVIIIDDVTFNLQSYTVSKDAFPVPMSPKEYAIIEYLLRNR